MVDVSLSITLFLGTLFLFVQAQTTPNSGQWDVTSGGCNMKMTFGATFSLPYTATDGSSQLQDVDLADFAMYDESSCSGNTATLYLRFYLGPINPTVYCWLYVLDFSKDSKDYKMTKITLQYVVDERFPAAQNGGAVIKESTQDFNPSAKLGTYIGDDLVSFKVGLSQIKVVMTNVKLQPFGDSVSDGGYGTITAFDTSPSSADMVMPLGVWFLIASLMLAMFTAKL